MLRPNMPPEGVVKDGPSPDDPRVNPRLKAVGQAVGIEFTGKCDRYPNTLRAHALLEYASEVDGGWKQNDLMEVMFKEYFTDGLYPDASNLAKQAASVGLPAEEVKSVLQSEERIQAAGQKAKEASCKGVTGVPYFFMNGQRTFSGAQDPEAFVEMFDTIHAKFPCNG